MILVVIYLISLTFIFAFYLGQEDGRFETAWDNVILLSLIPILNTLITVFILTIVLIDLRKAYFANKKISNSL